MCHCTASPASKPYVRRSHSHSPRPCVKVHEERESAGVRARAKGGCTLAHRSVLRTGALQRCSLLYARGFRSSSMVGIPNRPGCQRSMQGPQPCAGTGLSEPRREREPRTNWPLRCLGGPPDLPLPRGVARGARRMGPRHTATLTHPWPLSVRRGVARRRRFVRAHTDRCV